MITKKTQRLPLTNTQDLDRHIPNNSTWIRYAKQYNRKNRKNFDSKLYP